MTYLRLKIRALHFKIEDSNAKLLIYCSLCISSYQIFISVPLLWRSTDNLSLHTFSIGNPNLLCFEIDSVPQFCPEKKIDLKVLDLK